MWYNHNMSMEETPKSFKLLNPLKALIVSVIWAILLTVFLVVFSIIILASLDRLDLARDYLWVAWIVSVAFLLTAFWVFGKYCSLDLDGERLVARSLFGSDKIIKLSEIKSVSRVNSAVYGGRFDYVSWLPQWLFYYEEIVFPAIIKTKTTSSLFFFNNSTYGVFKGHLMGYGVNVTDKRGVRGIEI